MIKTFSKEIRLVLLSVKYSIMKEMPNKFTFITNVVFMILNNASFILEWIILFSIRNEIGGYGFKEVMVLWGFAAGTYGFCHLFFGNAIHLSDMIVNGELDAYLVQPKDALLSAISSKCQISAIGDLIYAFVMLIIYGFSIPNLLLYTFAIVCGGIIYASVSVIYNALSFWFGKVDVITETVNNVFINFATYPDSVFKGGVRFLLYTLIPVGLSNYLPVWLMIDFRPELFIILGLSTILFAVFAHGIFNKGLARYSSSNLMNARV